MHMVAYWIGNFIVDTLKMQLTILTTIVCFFGFKAGMENAIYAYLLFPLGVIPFTYVTSFIFQVDSAAQTSTMFLHFGSLAIISNLV